MSAKPIREYDGKHLLSYWLPKINESINGSKMALLDFTSGATAESVFAKAELKYSWLKDAALVCKPDQLIKRRGKNGLLGINLTWPQVKEWISKRVGTQIKVGIYNLD
jgi:ATP citrate (pro-S)-lyase